MIIEDNCTDTLIKLIQFNTYIHTYTYIYIYIYKERPHLREHEALPSGALLEDSLAIKDMVFLFPLLHHFKTIPLSLTKISTLCLLNKHQLKENDSLFS